MRTPVLILGAILVLTSLTIIDLSEEASGGALYLVYGYVYDPYGNPVPDAFVNVSDADLGEYASDITDASGRYTVNFDGFTGTPGNGDRIWVNATLHFIGTNNSVISDLTLGGHYSNVTMTDIAGPQVIDEIKLLSSSIYSGPSDEYNIVEVPLSGRLVAWPALFNSTHGYLKHCKGDWSLNSANATGCMIDNSSGEHPKCTFQAGTGSGWAILSCHNSTYNKDLDQNITVLHPRLDSLTIMNPSSLPYTDQNVGVASSRTCYAWGYNNTAGYYGPVSVNWTLEPLGVSSTLSTSSGTEVQFNAASSQEITTLKAVVTSKGHVHEDTVVFTVVPASIDSLDIVTTQDSGAPSLLDCTLPVGIQLQAWLAGFNDTIGYVRDLAGDWDVSNFESASSSTSPNNSTSSTLSLGTNGGYVHWTAEFGGMTDIVNITISPPDVDWINITTSPGGSMESNTNPPVGWSRTLYASAYNKTSGYLGLRDVAWTIEGTADTAGLNQTNGKSVLIDSGLWEGKLFINATLGWINTGVQYSVQAPDADYLEILGMKAPSSYTISNQTLAVAQTITGYSAVFNHTSGFLEWVQGIWEVVNYSGANTSTSAPYANQSTLYSGWHGGWAIWTCEYMGLTDAVNISVTEAKMEWLNITMQQGSPDTEHWMSDYQ